MPSSNDIVYTMDVSHLTLAALADLYESVGFGEAEGYKADQNLLKAVFGPGIYGVFAFAGDGGPLVGMARVMSDNQICTWVAEVCVHPDWQRKGIGGTLVTRIIDRFGHTAIFLEAFANQSGFFAKRGLTPKPRLVACSRAAQVPATAETEKPFMH